MIYLVFALSLFAHEDLDSTRCTFKNEQVTIEKLKNHQYKIQTPGMKSALILPKPQTKDVWDPKNKQTFDTYTFSNKDFTLVVKRPETQGPIKNKVAVWKDKQFNCK